MISEDRSESLNYLVAIFAFMSEGTDKYTGIYPGCTDADLDQWATVPPGLVVFPKEFLAQPFVRSEQYDGRRVWYGLREEEALDWLVSVGWMTAEELDYVQAIRTLTLMEG